MYRLLILLILAFWLAFSDSAIASYRPYTVPDFSKSPRLISEPKQSNNVTVLPTNLGGKPTIISNEPINGTNGTPDQTSTPDQCTNPSNATGQQIADRILNNRILAERMSTEGRKSIPIVIEECAKIGITDNARLAGLLTQIMLESSGRPSAVNSTECHQAPCSDGTPACAEGLIQVVADANSECPEKRRIWREMQNMYPDLKNQPYKPRWISEVRNGARIACQYAKKNRWFNGQYSMDELGIIGDKPTLTKDQAIKLRQSVYGVSYQKEVIDSAMELHYYYPIMYKEIVTARKNATTPNCTTTNNGQNVPVAPQEDGPPVSDEDADKWCSPHENGCITDVFGYFRIWRGTWHWGIDIASSNPGGKVYIYAAKAGKVRIGQDNCGEPLIEILHPKNRDNVTMTRYVHLRPRSLMVKDGQTVKCGQALALEGGNSPGNCSTGYHLHFEIYCKQLVDPECFPAVKGTKSCLGVSGSEVRRQRGPLCKKAQSVCRSDLSGQRQPRNNQPKLTAYNHCYYGDHIAKADQLKSVGNGQTMIRPAADAYLEMAKAAAQDGINLMPLSGFRNIKDQKEIFNSVVVPTKERAYSVAPPKYSEHHTGYAIDIGDASVPSANISSSFANTPAFAWLSKNARRFNFELSFDQNNCQKIMYEPWHWRYVGDGKMKQLVNRCFKAGAGSCKA